MAGTSGVTGTTLPPAIAKIPPVQPAIRRVQVDDDESNPRRAASIASVTRIGLEDVGIGVVSS